MKKIVLLFLLLWLSGFAQHKKIRILSAEFTTTDEQKFPGALISIGNVEAVHQGIILHCQRGLFYKNLNLFKAMGKVVLQQGDTITQTSDYVDYNGNSKQTLSWGNVVLKDPTMTLTTDTLHFNRQKQQLYYNSFATIKDSINILKSQNGNYDLTIRKFTATTNVSITNPEHLLKSTHLDYYTNNGMAYLYGPSTIIDTKTDNKIYCERGSYNTKTDISRFVKHAKLFLKHRTIQADSLYYDKHRGFASATNHIKVVDTSENFVSKGNYAEYFQKKDSLFIIKKAVAISISDKDSIYIHGDTLLVTGKPKQRIARIYHNAKLFKADLQGKCDSIYSNQAEGITKMFKNPVLWLGGNQITGDSIQLLSNLKTKALDSLKILNNALVIQQDSISKENFNQIKGRNIYGKFIKNKLKHLLVRGNATVIHFNKNKETQALETITHQLCSYIIFGLTNNQIESIKCFKNTEGKTYPPSKFPKEARKLKGFIWRETERPKTMKSIFIKSEVNVIKSKTDKNREPS